MPTADIDGLATRYELVGDGPPLLMFSPGGFDARLENWRTLGLYKKTRVLEQVAKNYTCITFDRREAGQSGGRVQRITWQDYAAQGKGLLDHLGIARAYVAGGCAGCSVVTEFAVRYPGATAALVLLSPAGGARYRIRQQERFTRHLAFVAERGLAGVAELARSSGQAFGQDPRVGPWGTVVARDESFAVAYAARDQRLYEATVAAMARTLFDRDTVPGPEPEDLMGLALPALIVPGQDASHATSAARYLQECLPGAQYWDVPVSAQDEVTLPAQVLEFLDSVSSG
jgi:pimeloyl-ACP methyl ester carboxylesterase